MNWDPVVRANIKPEQAALRSNPQAFVAPTLWAIRLDVEGNSISGVTVAVMMTSISEGSMPLFLHRVLTASAPISEVALVGSLRMCRWEIPVRDLIHSSFVSTIFARSSFVKRSSGTYPATLVIAAIILLLISSQSYISI